MRQDSGRRFDRTYEELKLDTPCITGLVCIGFDRTYEELKLLLAFMDINVSAGFDRTYEELKPRARQYIRTRPSSF